MIKQQLAHPNIVRYHKCFQVRKMEIPLICVLNTALHCLKCVLCIESVVTSLETAVHYDVHVC